MVWCAAARPIELLKFQSFNNDQMREFPLQTFFLRCFVLMEGLRGAGKWTACNGQAITRICARPMKMTLFET